MDEDREFALESRLTNHGCYLREVAESGDTCHLTYQSAAADQHGEIPQQQVGDIVNVFRKLFADAGWSVRSVEATVTDLDDEPLGSWRAEQEWFDALADGTMTEVEFSRRVVDSLEP
ncbi:hypothetical protein LPA44_07660 [Halobacterium sp. KA-4]|uniref:hypothetical protein n=1 Tax=Halobacterium sp. KA-4 TaxID=2896367 RepID=UPI001E4E9E86|nr:hypothetical protein [Halobacterium sp. KA-4]MCD2199771.1 hypothetical protein [Halobacterium sp. KA-4]